jgi:transmembrane sensor
VAEDLIIRLLQGNATGDEKQELRKWRRAAPENEERFRALVRLWSLTSAAQPTLDEARLPDIDVLVRRAMLAPVMGPTEVRDEREATGPTAAPHEMPSTRPTGAPHEMVATGPTAAPHEMPAVRPAEEWQEREAAGAPQKGPGGLPGIRRLGRLPGIRRPGRVAHLLKVAALGLLFIPLGFGLGWFAGGGDRVASVVPENEIITGDGEMATIAMQDGSSIRLGPRSRLRLREDGEARMAWLEGRAFFGIAPNSSRPFIVRTQHGEATVLGTRFEVRNEDVEFRVLVVEGSVQVSSGGEDARLEAGEMSRARSGEAPGVWAVEDVYAELGWMGNALVFQSTPLPSAIREIELRYGVTVLLLTPSLAELSITATLTDLQVHDVAMIVCEIIGAQCFIDADTIRMERAIPGRIAPGSRPNQPGAAK